MFVTGELFSCFFLLFFFRGVSHGMNSRCLLFWPQSVVCQVKDPQDRKAMRGLGAAKVESVEHVGSAWLEWSCILLAEAVNYDIFCANHRLHWVEVHHTCLA